MPELQIIGAPQSNYVWVTRIACIEKGVPYTLVPVMPHSPEVDAIHPFGKIPVMRHGDITLCEFARDLLLHRPCLRGPAAGAERRDRGRADRAMGLARQHAYRPAARAPVSRGVFLSAHAGWPARSRGYRRGPAQNGTAFRGARSRCGQNRPSRRRKPLSRRHQPAADPVLRGQIAGKPGDAAALGESRRVLPAAYGASERQRDNRRRLFPVVPRGKSRAERRRMRCAICS